MRRKDKQLGKPYEDFTDTKANIEARTDVALGAHATATDNPSAPFGVYDCMWHWSDGESGGGSGISDAPSDSIYYGRRNAVWVNLKTYFDGLYQAIGTYLTSANIVGTITNGVTDKAPSEDAVFDALAGKETAGAAATAESNAKSYADGLVVGLWDDRGTFDASVNAYPSSGGSGTAGAILKGDVWTVSVAGTLPTSQVVEVGDIVRALVDTPGNTQANWAIQQNNIGYTAENSANKVTSISGSSTDTQYPSAKLVYDQLAGKQAAGSYLTSANIEDSIVDGHTTVAPSGNAVYDALAGKAATNQKLDDFGTPDDNTDLNANTTNHGLLLKATAPAAGVRNVVAIDNGETAYKDAALVDSTNPAALGSVAPGTELVAARRDHVHAMPTYSDVGAPALAHTHTGTTDGSKLAQANTHESPDTDSATSSLHHTIGTTATTAAAGNHTHAGGTLDYDQIHAEIG